MDCGYSDIITIMKVKIFLTGGTFDKEYDEINARLYFKESHLPEMLKLGRSGIDTSVETLMMIDSLDMTDQDRFSILESCKKTEEDRIVITHGTDTMPQTAQVLGGHKRQNYRVNWCDGPL